MPVKATYFAFSGGLNEVDPPLTVRPGFLLDGLNYEQGVRGGYRRIDGFERFDGRQRPSDATYWVLDFEQGTRPLVAGDVLIQGTTNLDVLDDAVVVTGDTATGDAAGRVPVLAVEGVAITDVLAPGPVFVGATQAAVLTAQIESGADNNIENAAWSRLAIELVRSRIQTVPGDGPVRGVVLYQDTVYAFRDNGAAQRMYRSSPTGWQLVATPALLPGGRYEFVHANVRGSAGSHRLYGCDGVNPAFEFDGTVMTRIASGMVPDTPIHIAEHTRHLFLAFAQGSLQHSAIGDPLTWTPVLGAAEFATEDEITGLQPLPGGTLLVGNRETTYILYGTSRVDWQLREHSDTTGVIEWSLQRVNNAIYADDRGLIALAAVQEFGDFEDATFSQLMQRTFRGLKTSIVASCIVRDKNQYRIFFKGGQALYVTFDDRRVAGITGVLMPFRVYSPRSDEDLDGNERLFFGADDGFVYEMDRGTSYDSVAIEAFLRPVFNNVKSPDLRKRFRKITFELESGSEGELFFQPSFSYDDGESASSRNQRLLVGVSGGTWNVHNWNRFVWSGAETQRPEAKIDGTGTNLGMVIYSNAAYEQPHIIYGATVHYSPRRLER